MGIQDKLRRGNLRAMRKFYDRQITLSGTNTKVAHISISDQEKYSDLGTMEFEIDDDYKDIIIDFPEEIPFYHFVDKSGVERTVNQTNMALFDLLPIEIYTKYGDKIEDNDLIVYQSLDEYGNKMSLLLQITYTAGTIFRDILWKKQFAAVYSGPLLTTFKDYIQNMDIPL